MAYLDMKNELNPKFQFEKEPLQTNLSNSEYFINYIENRKRGDPLERYKLPSEWYRTNPHPPIIQRMHHKVPDLIDPLKYSFAKFRAGTTQGSNHIQNYTGHIPKDHFNPKLYSQSVAPNPRPGPLRDDMLLKFKPSRVPNAMGLQEQIEYINRMS